MRVWLSNRCLGNVVAALLAVAPCSFEAAGATSLLLDDSEELATAKSLGEMFELPELASTPPLDDMMLDDSVEPAQLQNPAARGGASRAPLQLAQRTPRVAAAASVGAYVGLASIPYMIGDTGSGTCVGLGGGVQGMLSHPTLACGRLNVSEANTPRPMDRVYYSYRHFHRASTVSLFQFSETVDLEQHTLAWENTFWDAIGSLELRLPVEHRLTSEIFSFSVPNQDLIDPLIAPNGGRRTELGNMSAVLKFLIYEQDDFALSGGLGVLLPTAGGVRYAVAVDGLFELPDNPGISVDSVSIFQLVFDNETVYLSPFLAWAYAPQQARWFQQGFLQVEVAANPSQVTAEALGINLYFQNGVPVGILNYQTPGALPIDLFAQTLLRLNLGTGYHLIRPGEASWIDQLSALFEVHYTSTLEDANLSELPIQVITQIGTITPQTVTVGNQDNRVDIVNAAVGTAGQWGPWTVINGVVAPIREAPDRGFDFEYNLQLQRLF
jgi:hypothetical protein